MIEINDLSEGRRFIDRELKQEIIFQDKIKFFDEERFIKFIEKLENGYVGTVPSNANRSIFYLNRLTVYGNKCIITEDEIFIFNNEELILSTYRGPYDSLEVSYWIGDDCKQSDLIIYDEETDELYEEYRIYSLAEKREKENKIIVMR